MGGGGGGVRVEGPQTPSALIPRAVVGAQAEAYVVQGSHLFPVRVAFFFQLGYDLLQAAQLPQVLAVPAEQWGPGDVRAVGRQEEALR